MAKSTKTEKSGKCAQLARIEAALAARVASVALLTREHRRIAEHFQDFAKMQANQGQQLATLITALRAMQQAAGFRASVLLIGERVPHELDGPNPAAGPGTIAGWTIALTDGEQQQLRFDPQAGYEVGAQLVALNGAALSEVRLGYRSITATIGLCPVVQLPYPLQPGIALMFKVGASTLRQVQW